MEPAPAFLFQLIYVSTATQPMQREQLFSLLQTSRERNLTLGITGMLLYQNGTFMQLLEGSAENVLSRFERIATDERHKWVIKLMTGPAEERDFPDWSMGFYDFDHDKSACVPGFTTFLQDGFNSSTYVEDLSHAKRTLLSFKNAE